MAGIFISALKKQVVVCILCYGFINIVQEFGVPRQRGALYDTTVIILPMEQLEQCLSSLPRSELLPTLQDIRSAEPNKLPLIIREKEVKFQCRRAVAYRRLLQGYPFRLVNYTLGDNTSSRPLSPPTPSTLSRRRVQKRGSAYYNYFLHT